MLSRYSVRQSSSVAGVTRGSTACVASSPQTVQPASSSIVTRGFRCVPAQARSTSRVSAAPQTPVRRIFALSTMRFAIARSAGPVDVDVHDAFEMREDRDSRLGLDPGHEALAAARHDDVEVAVEAGQHGADRRPVAGRDEADRAPGKARLLEPLPHRLRDLPRGPEAVGAGPQDRGVAGLEAERSGIRRDVGPALEDDADDAERRRHALDGEAVRALEDGEHAPDRIRQCRDALHGGGDGLEAVRIERQAVDEGGGLSLRFASATSSRLAARMASERPRIEAAMARRAASFSACEAVASRRAACRASRPSRDSSAAVSAWDESPEPALSPDRSVCAVCRVASSMSLKPVRSGSYSIGQESGPHFRDPSAALSLKAAASAIARSRQERRDVHVYFDNDIGVR